MVVTNINRKIAWDAGVGAFIGITVGQLGGGWIILLLVLGAYIAGMFYENILRYIGAVE